MTSKRPIWAPTGAALLAATLVAAATVAATPAEASPPIAAPGATVITLVTGDQISVTGTGRTARFAARSGAPRSGFHQFRDQAGDDFIVPAIAYPYLGNGLDLSLFDVSALLRDGVTGAARTPVTVTSAPGKAASAPPGVSLGANNEAFLTPRSSGELGAALRRQIGADVAAGRRPGSTPLPGTASIALSGHRARAAAPATTGPLRTLELDETDETGAPANTLTMLTNADSTRHFTDYLPVVNGVAKVNLVPGHYLAATSFYTFDSAGNFTELRQVVRTAITVADSPKPTTATLDARTATSQVTVATPRPASAVSQLPSVVFGDDSGGVSGFGDVIEGEPIYVNPQPAPRVGKVHYVLQWNGIAADGSDSYRYDAAFAEDHGIPANQRHVLRAGQLATVRHEVYGDPLATMPGQFLAVATDPLLSAGSLSFFPLFMPQKMPGRFTEYVATQPHGIWFQGVQTGSDLTIEASVRTFAAGRGYHVEWLHGPLAPQFGQYPAAENYCVACTAGTSLEIVPSFVGDSEPDHSETFFGPAAMTGHFKLTRDGTVLADSDSRLSAFVQADPQTPSTYVATTDIDLSAVPEMSQGTRSHTELTIKYDPAGDPGSTLPAAAGCLAGTATAPCQVLPVVSARYQLATDDRNTSTSPVQRMTLTVAHLSYDGHGSHAPITSAAVTVSFDGGVTWTPAKVTGSAGHYTVSWPNSGAAGSSPSLRVTATDAAGNAIDQTIEKAYTFGGSK